MAGGSSPLDTKHGQYLGPWGNLGSQTQKGIVTYALSANRQRPLAGTANAAIFNSWRRFRAQALYVIPPFALAYLAMNWAIEKNEYLNSKPGRIHDAEESAEARQGGSLERPVGIPAYFVKAWRWMSKLRLFFDLEILSSATSTKLQREPQTAMAKEKSADKEERKKEKKASKEKRSETNGVHKTKSDKKDKKQKKIAAAAGDQAVTTKLLNALEEDKPGSVAVKEEGDIEVKVKAAPLLGALVPFANPLADDKVGKKLLKTVKKSAKQKTLKRGVKEVVKAVRKSPTTSSGDTPHSVVVIAADISPLDVISHIPVLCEDHELPYIFVTSRTELGAAGSTKRPTSVVMISRDKSGKKKEEKKDEGEEDWGEVYKELVKVVKKASKDVRI